MYQRVLLLLSLLIPSFLGAQTNSVRTYTSKTGEKFQYEILLKSRGEIIWGFDFLNPEQVLFTERSGKIWIYNLKDKTTVEVNGAPKVWTHGQGGLLDIRVHPERKNVIYMTYAEPKGKGGTPALGMATLEGTKLTNFKNLFSALEANGNGEHFGSRIVFDGKGHILFAVGDRGERPQVQNLAYHMGKVLRLKEDGSIPADNPYVKTKGARPEIWAQGVRSPQGLDFHPVSGELYEAEMGPRGGDEINILQAGKNYGWPDVTYGREYYGPKIGKQEDPSTVAPLVYWVPSISPSALTFYRGNQLKSWKHHIFLANLSGQHIRRVEVKDGKVTDQEELLKDVQQRFRNIRTGPDGALYVSTDDGTLARIRTPGN